MALFETHKNWINDYEHQAITHEVIFKDAWRFGQASDENIQPHYPQWFQNFYDLRTWDYKKETPHIVKVLTERFLELCPKGYKIARSMVSSNTFGLDGDYHTDWPFPNQSITGVLYTDRQWETNWGGATIFKQGDVMEASEYEPRKLITFDASILHIGSGPQRRCSQMRSIFAVQAVDEDALTERMKIKLDNKS